MELPKLNFQDNFDFKFKRDKDKLFIYDLVRKTYLLLTPEEWVRQHWVHYYITVKSYATSALITEKKIVLNGLTKRIDLLVTEKTEPIILIECKAPHISLTQKTFEQTARYNSVIEAKQIVLTNGLQHIYADFVDNKYQFVRQ
ncbi:MAG: type I restriction enzyme HsdR N-terminal domain-containing protein [Chryseobacterium sp.]|nr:type I restriction enzyme HsdR N-terminal domain-containing protein [Candidatus Chryseobacterium enterohippi]